MRIINKKEIENVIKIDDQRRYKYFMNFVCDQQEAWGLFNNGWALSGSNNSETELFPLWPAKEFSEFCSLKEWKDYKAKPISLTELLEDLIPEVQKKKMAFAIFHTPENKGIVISPEILFCHLQEELKKY